MELNPEWMVSSQDLILWVSVSSVKDLGLVKNDVFRVEKYLTRSRILKVLVSEGVVSISNGMVSVSVLNDEVSDDEAETPSLLLSSPGTPQ